MTDVRVRTATDADLDAAARVFSEENRLHATLLPHIFRVAEPVISEAWLQEVLADPRRSLLVGEVGEEVAAVLLIRVQSAPENPIYRPCRSAYIEEMAVLASHRGRGVGARMMESAVEWARDRGAEEILLDVWEANEEAISFYEKLGFRRTQWRMARNLEPGE